jgi:hypothetical protein
MRRMLGNMWLAVLLLAMPLAATATTMLDFEDLGDGVAPGLSYHGVSFSNAVTLTVGISLNEFEFPPHSGDVVVSDDGGPIELVFAAPVTSVFGYFTYSSTLTFQAFDAFNALIGSEVSAFTSNIALSGDSGSAPNEVLGFSSSNGIGRVWITGDSSGGSFTLDDLTFESVRPLNGVPEPSTLALLAVGWVVLRRRCCERQLG